MNTLAEIFRQTELSASRIVRLNQIRREMGERAINPPILLSDAQQAEFRRRQTVVGRLMAQGRYPEASVCNMTGDTPNDCY